MDVGRLAWRTPTGGMLWEIWGRHKVNFLFQAIALASSVCFVHWKEHIASDALGDLLGIASFAFLIGANCHLLVCFGYVEVDSGKVQFCFPGRLLFKPVSTAWLTLLPMLFGGAALLTLFSIWAELVLQHLIGFTASSLVWGGTVLLSFFWWMQVIAWSLPFLRGRVLVVVMAGVIHFVVWCLPRMKTSLSSGRQWSILGGLLASAGLAAWIGLKLVRRGTWEGPSRISTLWNRLRLTPARSPRTQFGSAFAAQFWLEWRRQGWLLPCISGGMIFLILPLVLKCFQWVGAEAAPPEVILGVLILPLMLSVLLTPALARFDSFHSTTELPVYIAVRPMTNGEFVMAKLLMALATSALTWLVTVAACCFWLAVVERGPLLSNIGLVTLYGPVAFLTGCVPGLLLLVIWTWKNLVAGIGACLTGRPWIVGVSVYCRIVLLCALVPLVGVARSNVNFRELLVHRLTAILVVCLVAKIAISIAAFVWGARWNAITARAAGWIIGGWTVCGLFVAAFAGLVFRAINIPGLWIWVALGGFLLLPLADLAIAPLALAWNRHR